MNELYFVTSNEGKIKEAKMILDFPIKAVKADLIEIQSLDLEEIVRDKAQRAFALVQKPLIVDDVGLYVEAWNGFPGPFVKQLRDSVGNLGFLKMMENETNRRVIAKAAVGFHDGKEIHTFTGEVKGQLALEPRGEGGWGWDPIFIPEFSDKTYAEMTPEGKNSVSHRRAALEIFKNFLTQHNIIF